MKIEDNASVTSRVGSQAAAPAAPGDIFLDLIQQASTQHAAGADAATTKADDVNKSDLSSTPLKKDPQKDADKQAEITAAQESIINSQLLADITPSMPNKPMINQATVSQQKDMKPAPNSIKPVTQALQLTLAKANITLVQAKTTQLATIASTQTMPITDTTAAIPVDTKLVLNNMMNPSGNNLKAGQIVNGQPAATAYLPDSVASGSNMLNIPTVNMKMSDPVMKPIPDIVTKNTNISNKEENRSDLMVNEKLVKQTQDLPPLINSEIAALPTMTAKIPQPKIADAMAQLGTVIQNHVSQTLSNPGLPTSALNMPANHFSAIQGEANLARATPAEELHLDIPVDLTASHIKESFETNIKIYPPELGSVLAKLKVDKNNAQLVILTENNQVKSIVEANLQQLRDHFHQSNLNLTNIQVHVETSAGGGQDQNTNKHAKAGEFVSDSPANEADKQGPVAADSAKTSDKIIDTYA